MKPIVIVIILKFISGSFAGNPKLPVYESHFSEVLVAAVSAIREPSIIAPIISSKRYKTFFIKNVAGCHEILSREKMPLPPFMFIIENDKIL